MNSAIRWTGLLACGLLLSVSRGLMAGPVAVPNTFAAGTPAKASEVNADFTAVADAVNDNASRVAALEAGAATPAGLNARNGSSDTYVGHGNSSRLIKDHIADMGAASSLLMQLRPVTFHYKSDENPRGRSLQYGLIAEEVAEVAPGLVARSRDGEIETVYYQFLPPMLLNEYQKQQRTIEAQGARIAELEQLARRQGAKIQRQSARLDALEGQREEFDQLRQQTAHIAAVLFRMQAASVSGKSGDRQ